ncbi:MAG: hypothetical protein IPM97_12565 [Bdellovibrionaceae bacterium]|nr:hypothetical protein [Pseudobdellovibrionaceae bacterium]
MKKVLLLLMTSSMLSACDELNFRGQIKVYRSFEVVEQYNQVSCNERVDWWNCQNKSVNFSEGLHTAEVTLTESGGDPTIVVKVEGNKSQQVKITGNKNVKISDNFHIRAVDINQKFDIKGSIDTKITDGPEMSGVETCSETHYETRCRWEDLDGDRRGRDGRPDRGDDRHGPGHGPGHGGREVCERVPITLYGDRDVTYYHETTEKNLKSQFVQGSDVLADITGRHTRVRKVYTYQGYCRLHSRH